ncbi:MAG: regulatory protein RecX [Deferribacteres bacterium]|nr:regulatory protein RecX [Deferribacteres bacterium]
MTRPRSKGSRADVADVKAYALKLLGYRSRSRREMLRRLKMKGFDDGRINDAIKFLEDTGLLSDEDLAPRLLRHSVEDKHLGGKGIRAFLTKRGLDKELVDKTMLLHTVEMEEESARQLVEKKLRAMKGHPGDVIRRRLWGMLQRRGFSGDVISRVVDSVKV